ncbi:MAG: 2'-5' RNA ligase family protein [Chloroflexi bacterium]|jgi:2'-5' RNA ligase|nr:2'-5' RNA ligase family protein [Chloroflexota bacterium]MBT3670748.1 2'-5' RNA ligase family protein [Chloroflexota bacterium]MBT4305116.1 2'-5' RNA ligase family protein [Chloroflexota bacterium]MBT4533362.1 2'-5' RNA ligase family protein [Chloroflexota bacterium]MBT4682882.1 2'-5' RNA ligase family protein [Chloroflexota bacterium]
MHGLVSLLDKKYSQEVEDIWDQLEAECGLSGIRVSPYPHFSWQVTEEYNWMGIEEAMKEIALKIKPFTVQATGIGIFSGENSPLPVIYIPVLRTASINSIHQYIWKRTENFIEGANPYYFSHSWMPHISLAYQDVNSKNIICAMKQLAFRNINWTLTIDNISLIKEAEGDVGNLVHRFNFQA